MIEGSRWPSWVFRVAIAAISLFIIAPIAVVLIGSFTAGDSVVFPPQGLSLRWYVTLVRGHADLVEAFWVSLELALVSAGLATAVGLLAGFALVRYDFAGRQPLTLLFLSPLLVPSIVIGIAMLQFLSTIGLGFHPAGLLLGHVIITLPFAIRLIVASLVGLDPALELAARSLGAGRLAVFRRITLPLIRAGVVSGFILAFIVSFENVTVSLFLVSPQLVTLPVRIFGYIENSPTPVVTVASALLLFASGVLIAVLQRLVGVDRLWGSAHS